MPFVGLPAARPTSPSRRRQAAAAGDATLPPAFPPQDIVGRWGLAAYHKAEDRERTEAAARQPVQQPYVITLGPTGGVMMHLADQATPEELRLKGAPGGKTYIGPAGEPGGMQDREVVHFDGRILILRWMDPEVQGRYGTMVYVRCGAGGRASAARRSQRQTEAEAAPRPSLPPPAAEPGQPSARVPRWRTHAQPARRDVLRDPRDLSGPWRAVPVLGVTQILPGARSFIRRC